MLASFPHWTQTVSTGTKSSTVFRAIITNYALMQSNLRKAMLPYESMEAWTKSVIVSNKSVTGLISHNDITITASQHHKKLHGTTHVTATDAIPLTTSTKHGLLSTTNYRKINTISTNANYRPIVVGKYIANYPTASQTINIGFRPRYVKIFRGTVTAGNAQVFEIIDGNVKVITHEVSTYAHRLNPASHIAINANGFIARGSCHYGAVGANNYFYLAMG